MFNKCPFGPGVEGRVGSRDRSDRILLNSVRQPVKAPRSQYEMCKTLKFILYKLEPKSTLGRSLVFVQVFLPLFLLSKAVLSSVWGGGLIA